MQSVRWWIAVFSLVAISGSALADRPRLRASADEATPRVIGKFRDGASTSFGSTNPAVQSWISGLAARQAVSLTLARSVSDRMHALWLERPLRGRELDRVLRRLAADPSVEYAVADQRKYRASIPDDPLFNNTQETGQWWLTTPDSIAVSVHTIISWILATTVQPGWHSTVFGPYFVVGAIFSGIGALFIAMTIMRRIFHLEAYITEKQYRYLSYLLIAMTVIWFYFTYTEHLILAAGQQEAEFPILASKLWGAYAPSFWLMVGLMVAAFWVLVFPRLSPERWGRAAAFQPRFALGTTLSSAFAVALAFLPQAQPFAAGITSAEELAAQVSDLLRTDHYGLYHLTSEGQCTWFEFAAEFFSLLGKSPRLEPVSSRVFAAKARRPLYSVLENQRAKKIGLLDFSDWKNALRTYLEMKTLIPK